jgi:pimeloyl-ACP methyl ester carboxylesterase
MEPLLLLHGLGGSRAVWDPVVDLLAPQREVLVLDMPGFGEAPPLPAGVEATAANLAAAIGARLTTELGVERPHVAGNSLGGWVALELGRSGLAASVTAISPAGMWRQPIGDPSRDVHGYAGRFRPLVVAALQVPHLRRAMLSTFAARPDLIPAAQGRELVLGWIDASSYQEANRAMRSHVFDPAGYPSIPVTLAWGERDRLVGPPRPERRPAGSRFIVLPEVGHTPTWDDPELVARTLLDGSSVPAAV